ncbi:MAG: DsbE family thiol:disulfide interchange protein [Alcanivoracaceae bacterium]|jgi:cytochrome c biogenesis protein CcmG/thiol:disulfide interchange protein DsbE|nr:DsbE family thiol:disulfide interchange protein [Alcanivoracaceae bacterium]
MPSRKGLWMFLPLLAFLGLAVLLASGLGRDTEELPTALAGKPLPQMQLPSLMRRGTVVDNQLFVGHWTLLNVWATWCPTCYVEHPYLMKLAEQGIRIVGLNYKDEPDKARDYLARLGNPFIEVPVDETGSYGIDLGVYGAPETFVINPKGEVVLRYVGEVNDRSWQQRFAPVWKKESP